MGYIRMTVQPAIECLDKILDERVSSEYQSSPLAQDWARISKVAEELGEAIQVFIGLTGQNPKKGVTNALNDLRKELLDITATSLLAYQHFFKTDDAWAALETHMIYLHDRLCNA